MDSFKNLRDLMHNRVGSHSAASETKRAFSDADLSQLRDQIKKIMIPLLIRVFELKLAAQQASAPPSRITGQRPDRDKLQEIEAELSSLKDDLKLLRLWVTSCENQVQKALDQIIG